MPVRRLAKADPLARGQHPLMQRFGPVVDVPQPVKKTSPPLQDLARNVIQLLVKQLELADTPSTESGAPRCWSGICRTRPNQAFMCSGLI